MIGDGLAWLRLTLKYDAEKFPYGVPNVKVEVWGKQLFDPRTNKTIWSNNGALVVLDFYRSYLSVPDADIDFESFKVAADLCDEQVVSPEGVAEPRYTINGAYELSESPASILDHMHKCIAAEPTYVAGKHGILMQAYNGPAVLRIEPNQIIDTVNITPELALRDATNAIYGTFVDAEQLYIKTDFEPVIIEEWIDEDGLEIKENMDYRFVTSPYQASRLANLYLRKKRAGRRVQIKMNMDGYAYRPGEVILLNLPHIGIQNLEFRIAEWKFHPQEGVDILLEEDGAYIYEDVIGKPFVRPPFTVLPTGGVAPPLNLAFVPVSIGEIVQGYLSWKSAAADVRYNTVNIIQDGKVVQSIQVPQDRVDLSGLVRGSYRAEVRSINAAGAMSAPTIIDFDIQAPPKPVSVEVTGGMFSLTCVPRAGESAQHGYTFEFWFSDKKLANTNDLEVTTKSSRLGQGQFWTKESLKAGTDYWFYVRTVNSYGKSPFVEAVGQANALPADIIDEMGGQFMTTEAGKRLEDQLNWVNESNLIQGSAIFEVQQDLFTKHGQSMAQIKRLDRVFADANLAWAQSIVEVNASINGVKAGVIKNDQAIADLDKAFSKSVTELESSIGEVKSGVVKNDQAIASLNKSFAESQTQVQSKLDEQMAIVNTKATTEFTAKGEGYATWDVNAGVWYNKTFYKAGMVISAEVKAGKVSTYIGFMANNFAFINPSNGEFETFMYMKNGQIFMKETFIDKAWLNSVVVTDKMTSANYVPGKVGFNIDAKTGDAEFNKLLISGDFKIVGDAGRVLVDGTGMTVYDENGRWAVKVGRRPA
nr:DUF1983 domain-containing protein [Providencia sp. wls1950]